MRELSEDYGEAYKERKGLGITLAFYGMMGCVIGLLLAFAGAAVILAIWAFLWATEAKAHEAQPTAAMLSVDALWAKKREEA